MHYHYGLKDLVTILFYVFITIILHAVVQEYILDVSDQDWILRSEAGDPLGCRPSSLEKTTALIHSVPLGPLVGPPEARRLYHTWPPSSLSEFLVHI